MEAKCLPLVYPILRCCARAQRRAIGPPTIPLAISATARGVGLEQLDLGIARGVQRILALDGANIIGDDTTRIWSVANFASGGPR